MLNLVENWRYVGRVTKIIFFAINIASLVTTLLMVLTFNEDLSADFTRFTMFVQLIEMQVLFNIPLLVVLNLSGLLKRTIYERHNDDDE